jgi:1-deoxy-D-xylulose-5-phosphate synthase
MAEDLLSHIHSPADLKRLDVEQLPRVAEQIREAICEQVAQTGGHLAPNLGVVELTLAMHYVFDFGHDRLLFDVGHQCYPHKLLTGRQHLLPKLRQRGGMAGFPEPRESAYDLFSCGHAGTAISTAVGMARGDDVQAGGEGMSDRKAVALVGDASIVNGVALEGLNNAGTLKRQFLTVLNDNGMSIAHPQGAMAAYFDRIRVSPTYGELKKRAHRALERMPGGSVIEQIYHRSSEMLKTAICTDHMFEHFGLVCVGPVDGHDLPTLVDMFNEVRDIDRPVLLHAKTVKGKGYDFSSADPTKFHSPKPFKVEGCRVEVKSSGRAFSAAAAEAIGQMMETDESIYAVTAAMPDGTGLKSVIEQFPQRTLDTGICESHAMDMCAGLAKSGMKPFFTVYSTFVQRALDQMFQEVALQGHPVRICLDRAGYVGGDGAIHHGFMDMALFRSMPGVIMCAACDEPTLRAGLEFLRQYEDGPSVIRYPRDKVPSEPLQDNPPAFELGKANLVKRTGEHGPASDHEPTNGHAEASSPPPDLAILAYGPMVYTAAEAIETLSDRGYDIALYDARFAMPVDTDLLHALAGSNVPILTIEDHALSGGFGASVLEAMNDHGLPTHHVQRLGMPRSWMAQDTRENQLSEAGLDAASVARQIRACIEQSDNPAGNIAADRPQATSQVE